MHRARGDGRLDRRGSGRFGGRHWGRGRGSIAAAVLREEIVHRRPRRDGSVRAGRGGRLLGRGGFGGGLGIIGGLFRLLFGIALFFLVLRLIGRFMWGKRMGWGGGHGWGRHWGGPNGDDVPPHFAEWYRRMRAKETGVKTEDAPAPSEPPKSE